MKQNFPVFEAATRASMGRIAVLADGENLSFAAAQSLMHRIATLGDPTILRAYCSRQNPNGWDKDHRFQVTYLDTVGGKNSADIRLVIDAMDIAHARVVDAFVILSSDCDFAPLAHRLRNVGLWVLGAGRSETSDRFRLACSEFHVLEQVVKPKDNLVPQANVAPKTPAIKEPTKQIPKPPPLDRLDTLLRDVIKAEGKDGSLPIVNINAAIRKRMDFKIATTADKTWRAYLTNRPSIYACDPKGPNATVRLTRP